MNAIFTGDLTIRAFNYDKKEQKLGEKLFELDNCRSPLMHL